MLKDFEYEGNKKQNGIFVAIVSLLKTANTDIDEDSDLPDIEAVGNVNYLSFSLLISEDSVSQALIEEVVLTPPVLENPSLCNSGQSVSSAFNRDKRNSSSTSSLCNVFNPPKSTPRIRVASKKQIIKTSTPDPQILIKDNHRLYRIELKGHFQRHRFPSFLVLI